jgi:hypothetical protein
MRMSDTDFTVGRSNWLLRAARSHAYAATWNKVV